MSVNFRTISDFADPLFQKGTRYRQSKKGLLIYGHSCIPDRKNGVLWSTTNYVIESRKHPPSDLTAGLYTKWLARGRLWVEVFQFDAVASK